MWLDRSWYLLFLDGAVMQTLPMIVIALAVQAPTSTSSPLQGDVGERRQAVRAAAATAQTAGEEILPTIEAGLQDVDAQVRFGAAAALSQLTLRAARSDDHTPPLNLRGRPSLSSAIFKALDDPDFRVRGAAVKAVPFVADIATPAVQKSLNSMYANEGNEDVRSVILFEIARGGLETKDSRSLVVEALGDRAAVVRRNAALAVARIHPPEALPRIVDELKSGDEQTRSEFVHALASYGSAAKPHIGVLEHLLAIEVRNERKAQIAKAIQTIGASR